MIYNIPNLDSENNVSYNNATGVFTINNAGLYLISYESNTALDIAPTTSARQIYIIFSDSSHRLGQQTGIGMNSSAWQTSLSSSCYKEATAGITFRSHFDFSASVLPTGGSNAYLRCEIFVRRVN